MDNLPTMDLRIVTKSWSHGPQRALNKRPIPNAIWLKAFALAVIEAVSFYRYRANPSSSNA